MSFEPDPLQHLLLLRLAVSEQGGEFLKNVETSSLTPARRTPLVREGLVDEQKQKIDGKGAALIHFELTEKGWAWCQNHLDEPFRFRGQTPKLTAIVLERLLLLLKTYFETQDHTASFGKFIQQASRNRTAIAPEAYRDNGHGELESDLRRACLELGHGRENVRVRLADLRSRLPTVPRPILDDALRRMEGDGQLSLYALDNPAEITAADKDAVLRTSAGNERHILYFGGTSS